MSLPQGSGQGMQAEEERIHQVSREPSSCPGKPEQDINRRTQVTQGALLPQIRLIRYGRSSHRLISRFSRWKTMCYIIMSTLSWATPVGKY